MTANGLRMTAWKYTGIEHTIVEAVLKADPTGNMLKHPWDSFATRPPARPEPPGEPMAVVNMVFGSFNLHDEFFAKHQLNYLADIVRVLVYTGVRFNFYDVLVMALDAEVLKEQVDKARAVIGSDSSIATQRRLNFEAFLLW